MLANVAFLVVQDPSADALSEDEQTALTSAEARVGAMLTFSHSDLQADLSVARSNATGSFQKKYSRLLDSIVASSAGREKVTTRSVVTSAGVERTRGSSVTVLALVRSTTTVGSRKPAAEQLQLRVTLRPVQGQWLISDLRPI
ncbi:hypothetical protein ASD11_14305 [Aeromicrobium sp. Root495]|nr:hypothetical protein ASD11_14305 [Aeromicrobium sp. Root495]